MQPNMNLIMVWASMLWSSDAVEHERYYGLGVDARVSTLLWFGRGCSGHRMRTNMSVILNWAWMLWSSDAAQHERYYGFGVNALVTGRSQT